MGSLNFTTEYVGIDNERVYDPKCLSYLTNEPDTNVKRQILTSIASLWSSGYITNRKDSVIKTGKISPALKGYEEFFSFLLSQWIFLFNRDLEKHLAPIFKDKKEVSSFLRGKVNHVNAELRQLRGNNSIESTVSQLTYEIPELQICKSCILHIKKNTREIGFNSKALEKEVSRALILLRSVEELADPLSEAKKMNMKRLKIGSTRVITSLPPKLFGLNDFINFSVDLLLGLEQGLSTKSSNLNLQGIVFNLNYLFEGVIKQSFSILGGLSKSELFNEGKINSIESFSHDGQSITSNFLSPDVITYFKQPFKSPLKSMVPNVCFIFDAKHKFFSKENEISGSINRSDFHQIVAYSRTHHRKPEFEYVYGLAGLAIEKALITDEKYHTRNYVPNSQASISEVSYGVENGNIETFKIHRIPINFAQFLYDYSFINTDPIKTNLLFEILAINIINCINDFKK